MSNEVNGLKTSQWGGSLERTNHRQGELSSRSNQLVRCMLTVGYVKSQIIGKVVELPSIQEIDDAEFENKITTLNSKMNKYNQRSVAGYPIELIGNVFNVIFREIKNSNSSRSFKNDAEIICNILYQDVMNESSTESTNSTSATASMNSSASLNAQSGKSSPASSSRGTSPELSYQGSMFDRLSGVNSSITRHFPSMPASSSGSQQSCSYLSQGSSGSKRNLSSDWESFHADPKVVYKFIENSSDLLANSDGQGLMKLWGQSQF